MLSVTHNLAAMNSYRQLNTTSKSRAKSSEKLATGLSINRAADDAAGLAISEKMRQLIRGLDQGTKNAQDGVSWVQIGDGALTEAHSILQRMNELSVQALNGTNSESDREAIQQEFDQLQIELDRIGQTTEFNELDIFHEHLSTYYQCEGSIEWSPTATHTITAGRNDLTIKYRSSDNATQKTLSITVPAGEYTTQELSDEIDSAIEKAGGIEEGIFFEFNDEGYCNVNYEGGKIIDSVAGSLSYLLYDMYEGGEFGALIGTTSFAGGYPLKISSENNTLSFDIEDFDGNSSRKDIVIPDGWYYRDQLIDLLNNELQGTTVKATEYGEGIKLGSEDSIVTKFKGNMFKIDQKGSVYTSVFYDNVSYGEAELHAGYFQGGYVLNSNLKDVEYNKFKITDANNTLSIQANGADSPVTIQLTNGEYSIDQMKTELQNQFNNHGLELDVTHHLQNSFYSLRITSRLEGIESTIDIDPSSSAYDTLFVNKTYTYYGTTASVYNENKADVIANFTGSKELTGFTTSPLTIVAGDNDSFKLTLDNTTTTIVLSAKDYNSAKELEDEINYQLQQNNITSVEAVLSGNKMKIQGVTADSVTNINVSAVTNNGGMDAVFQGYNITYKDVTISGKGSITLDQPYDGTVESSDNPLKVKVDGTEYKVNLPVGNPTQDQIIDAIEKAIPGRTETVYNTFSTTYAYGDTTNRDYAPVTKTGTATTSTWTVSNAGSTTFQEGTTQVGKDTPATVTLSKYTLPDTIEVTDSNNRFTLEINGEKQTLILDNKTYTANTLKDALQSKINAVYGTGYGGAIVSINNNKLVLTARTDATHFGEDTEIICSTTDSTLMQELNTQRGPATLTSNLKLANSITIDENSNVFSFILKEDGVTKPVSITLAKGTYTPNTLVKEINSKLNAQNIGVTASVSSSGYLTLTTKATGTDTSISYGTTSGGSSAEVIFGPLETSTPAEKLVNLNTESEIKITDDTNGFNITVNGQPYSVTLDNGTYNATSFVEMLNQKLADANAPLEAYTSSDGKKIGYRTLASGSQQSFSINYTNGGSSMVAIYGKKEITYPGVDASFVDGKLMLKTDPSSTISVSSGSGGGLMSSETVKTAIYNPRTAGYASTTQGTIDGAGLNQPVKIDEFANDLSFTFVDEGTTRNISITVDEGSYTYDELKKKLQELLDTAAGANKLAVTVDSNGVVIKTVGTGLNNKLSDPKGDFYDKILCYSSESTYKQSVKSEDGSQVVSKTFTVGRKDITGGVTIRDGISDELSLDFTYDNTVYTLNMNLDAGEYSSSAIKNHIQDKLNEQLVANGFEAGLVKVGVGDIQTGVVGANDSRAINFQLDSSIAVPGEGKYLIDGVGGNAAFEIFYSTDGELIPAYVMGNKDITEGVTIAENEDQLVFNVDGNSYEITLEAKEYSYDEIFDAINTQLTDAGAPLIAEKDHGKLKISYVSLGKHPISIEGSARDEIFFSENGEEGPSVGVNIQLSSDVGDFISIPRTDMSTTLLGLNTICVTQEKYAFKALKRVGEAIDMVSYLRSTFGSIQNRLEHAINNNENKHENTTAAESRIRDTDMSEEMVNMSKLNILQQVGQAMLSQSNSSKDDVLKLLQ